jgi:hypothetical protein
MGLFGGKQGSGSQGAGARVTRHSSGWGQMIGYLTSHESLRILDIGPTSAGNINFITNLGHSIYMANLVEDAKKPEYQIAAEEGGTASIDVDKFLRQNLDFTGRTFDVVAFWDTADYLPGVLLQPTIDRIFEVMQPGGQLLAFFHTKATGEDTVFSRYHLTGGDRVEMQRVGGQNILQTYTNRQIEGVFHRFAGHKFFLAKDALREVIVSR